MGCTGAGLEGVVVWGALLALLALPLITGARVSSDQANRAWRMAQGAGLVAFVAGLAWLGEWWRFGKGMADHSLLVRPAQATLLFCAGITVVSVIKAWLGRHHPPSPMPIEEVPSAGVPRSDWGNSGASVGERLSR